MSSNEPNLSIDTRRYFLQALRKVLRPIIRLMIRSGVLYDEFTDMARAAYVESAVRDGIRDIVRPTRDQIALVTGIARDRIDHYIDNFHPLPAVKTLPAQVMSEILHRWHTDPQYQGPSGTPLELDLDESSEQSFQKLVSQVDTDTDPDLILNDLLHSGMVVHSGDTRVRAMSRHFIWPNGDAGGIDHFATSFERLVETHAHNFSHPDSKDKRLERSVFADRGLPEELLPNFHSFARERAEQFLVDLDDWIGLHSEESPNPVDERLEVGVGLFFYVDPPPDDTGIATLVQSRHNWAAAAKESGE